MASRLRKAPPTSRNSKTSDSENSVQSTPNHTPKTPPLPRATARPKTSPVSALTTDLTASLTVLELKRRSISSTLTASTEFLDTTRRRSRQSLMQNIGSTADLLDSTRRNVARGLKNKLRAGKDERRKGDEVGSEDSETFSLGEPTAPKVEQRERFNVEEERTPWPERRSSLVSIMVMMMARRGELRDSVIADSSWEDVFHRWEKPLPPHPEIDEHEGEDVEAMEERVLSYRHST